MAVSISAYLVESNCYRFCSIMNCMLPYIVCASLAVQHVVVGQIVVFCYNTYNRVAQSMHWGPGRDIRARPFYLKENENWN